ncbi:dihydrofolate reductase-like domain-containing protein [Mycena galericulata]|nr:dihydrofolate reductase-like domain-containing protein [Mycena galericulata]
MSRLTIIVAATKSNGIGQNATLPWRLPKEMANTWESIPTKFRPLRNRVNIVISRNANYDVGSARIEGSLQAAITRMNSEKDSSSRGFIIGGASLYAESLALAPSSPVGFVDRILLTRILSPAFDECDVFMPDFLGGTEGGGGWKMAAHDALQTWVGFEVAQGVQEENGIEYEFQMWVREPPSGRV